MAPIYHPTVRAFLAGGVPEVMLHLRALGLLDEAAMTATGEPLARVLDWWAASERRSRLRDRLFDAGRRRPRRGHHEPRPCPAERARPAR